MIISRFPCPHSRWLSYAEVKALASGNPLIKDKMQIDIEVAKLTEEITLIEKDTINLKQNINSPLVANNKEYADVKEGVKDIIETHKAYADKLETRYIGTYKGFELHSYFDRFRNFYNLTLSKNYKYAFEMNFVPQTTLDKIEKPLKA